MDKQIFFKTNKIEGIFEVPYSKSVSNRMLVVNALAGKKAQLKHLSDCDDTRLLAKALANDTPLVDVGNAGTAMRFLTAYFALVPGKHTLTGSPRMLQRPIGVLVDSLRELGADITYLGEEGYPPLRVTGGSLKSKNVIMDATVSSQYISALMMIGACLPGGLRLQLKGKPVSMPYLRMTAGVMRHCGAHVRVTDRVILVQEGGYPDVSEFYEYDWSAMSYFYELLAVAGKGWARFLRFRTASIQGDRSQTDLWEQLGVRTVLSLRGARINTIVKSSTRMDMDFTDMPDVVLPAAVACCLRNTPFRFSGLGTLRLKECDRTEALVSELGKLGYRLRREGGDVLSWDGTHEEPTSLSIDTRGDHRMVMAFTPAGLVFPGLVISDAEAVEKSFPGFWDELSPFLC